MTDATADTLFQRALRAHQAGDLDQAQRLYGQVLAAHPQQVNALTNLSTLYLHHGRFEEALLLVARALQIDPAQAALHYNYGNILMQAALYADAAAAYAQALALQPATAVFHSNHGIALFKLNRYAEAIASYDRAIALEPECAEYYNNRGNARGHLGQFTEALEDYARAVSLAPTLADAHWNRGLLQIMHGDFENGFRHYEWRWQRPSFAPDLRPLTKPLWLGDALLQGRTILIYPEQGLGDVIQFSRYVPMLEALGAQVILEAPAPLVALLRAVSKTATMIAKGATPPPYDFQCPIVSLPLAFRTTLASVPSAVPYLAAAPEKERIWQQKLGPKTRPRIGLAWSGSPTHVNDHNRSAPLAMLGPLLGMPYDFHAIQKDLREADRPYLGTMQHHGADLLDFTDTAALIAQMDLVISVDTSVAHLAGALAKPLWLLLPAIPDYRWLLARDDTPWYPSARLFRHPMPGDWAGTITAVAHALELYFPS